MAVAAHDQGGDRDGAGGVDGASRPQQLQPLHDGAGGAPLPQPRPAQLADVGCRGERRGSAAELLLLPRPFGVRAQPWERLRTTWVKR